MQSTLAQLRRCLEATADRKARAVCAASVIRGSGLYRWVGIYDVGPTDISVLAWSGPQAPANPCFPVTQGINGAVVASGSTVVVPDVTRDPRYLTTLGSTRSEIVVPVMSPTGGGVVGTLDVESERPNAFADEDRQFLEGCAALLSALWSRESTSSRERFHHG